MKLSLIIVNWNVKDLLRQCLTSIHASEYPHPYEIIVVDSASSDGSSAMVRVEFPTVTLIASDENLGYAKGNNLGVAHAQGEYLFLLNPDTHLPPHTLRHLSHHLDQHPGVGAVGPALFYGDGSPQSSRRRFPTLGSLFWESTLLEQYFPRNRHIRHYRLENTHRPAQPTPWLMGAALLIRRSAWQAVGPLDESLFMYFEETDWFRRLSETVWTAHFLPSAWLTHYEGKSSEQIVAERILRFNRSKLRYTEKWFGPRWAATLRHFLQLTFIWQMTIEAAKGHLNHKPALREQRVRAYRHVLETL